MFIYVAAVKLRNFDEIFKKKNAISRRLIPVCFPKTANFMLHIAFVHRNA